MIHVTGWTGIYHSYAMVNQWQLLSIYNKGRRISYKEAQLLPGYSKKTSPAGFPEPLEKKLDEITSSKFQAEIKAEYRITFPFDISPMPMRDVFVFGTAELGRYPHEGNAKKDEFVKKLNSNEFTLITPSAWSKNGFIRSGADESHIKVISHGVDTAIFKPFSHDQRKNLRRQIGIDQDDFVIANFGAMTLNKGVDLLLTAAWILRNKIPNLKILLKDAKSLYNISIGNVLANIPDVARDRIITDLKGKIILHSNPLSVYGMSQLYNVSDCYVSPYKAEGFNLTPLEASSCGIPIIVTKGGSTDDYFHDCMGSQIQSKIHESNIDESISLAPDIDSLVQEILNSYLNRESFNPDKAINLINENYTWDKITDDLISVLDHN